MGKELERRRWWNSMTVRVELFFFLVYKHIRPSINHASNSKTRGAFEVDN